MRGYLYNKGVGLIELLVVVVIVAVLVAIAYPSYQQYKVKTNRGEMKTEMMNIAQRLQSYYVVTPSYSAATLEDLDFAEEYPSEGQSYYQLTLETTAQTWTLTATPIASTAQNEDGVLMLNDRGQKCWDEGASSCSLSTTSSWD